MEIIKRDGRKVKYDGNKIVQAVAKAMKEVTGKVDKEVCYKVEEGVKRTLEAGNYPLTVEGIQDSVENTLMSLGDCNEVAKAYILYRAKRNDERGKPSKYKYLSETFLKPYRQQKDSFPTELGRMVYKRTYARPIPEENRREDWWETVARVVDFSTDLEILARRKQGQTITEVKRQELIKTAEKMYKHMFNLGLFPSGRSLWVGGTDSAYEYPLSNFNCSFITIDEFEKFSEMFFVLMLGTGVGLSVERKYIEQLPKVNTDIRVIHKAYTPVPKKDRLEYTEIEQPTYNMIRLNVGDSKFGWSEAMKYYLDIITKKQYKDIEVIIVNYDSVRPRGERLKTFGGYASGHENLKTMFEKIDKILEGLPKGWQPLKPIHALDIATIIAENVISGGKL